MASAGRAHPAAGGCRHRRHPAGGREGCWCQRSSPGTERRAKVPEVPRTPRRIPAVSDGTSPPLEPSSLCFRRRAGAPRWAASQLTDAVPASTSLFLLALILPDLFLLPGDVTDCLAPGPFPLSLWTGRGPGACFPLPRAHTPPRSYRRKQKTSLTSHLFHR